MQLTKKQLNNFWAKVKKTNDCWNWTAYTANGYGKVNLNGNSYLTHKVSLIIDGRLSEAYKKEKGAKGVVVMHTCDNRKCVNPKHLLVATQKENMEDAKVKGRKWYGENAGELNPNCTISKNKALAIKKSIKVNGNKLVYIAKSFHVGKNIVANIAYGKSWVHLKV